MPPAGPDHDGVRYRVLGPLAAISQETRVELGGKRQRLVLAVLLANANRVISQDALIDAVWNGVLPDSGARSLHTYVSVLRKALEGGIEREGGGYVLHVEPARLDALRFEELIAEGRSKTEVDAPEAALLLRRGLGLWTGTAFGDLGHEPALLETAERLAGERVAALEMRFEVDLLLGRHEQIIPEIEALLREEPYREHLAGMLMLALYRSGRQVEALRMYRNMRERLVEELGIEPGHELQDLELRILERDTALLTVSTGVAARDQEEVHGARGYEVHEPIGQTGFGDRFRGFHGTMAREVSVLVIDEALANAPQFVRQFEAEMQSVSRLEHPHLAPVFDYWRDPQNAYVITPFYRGGTLESAIADRPLTLGAAIRLADQLAAAIGFLHRQGHAHGAISAASVFLDGELNAYLTDTGLPRISGRGRQIGAADDVQQLGALIFQVLTLRRPDGVTTVSEWRSELPSDLDHAVSRALHPEPNLRYHRIEEFARALRQSAGLDVMAVPGEGIGDVERRNPYKGLRAFQEADASDFHGRDALVAEMVEALTSSRLVAVVGPSGSGKSSAVRAGLVPQLRRGAIPSSENWFITEMFPGAHPFEALESALLRVAVTRPVDLYETLTATANGLARVVGDLLQPGESEVLIVVDQFEELFSMVSSPSDRQQFLNALVGATDHESRLRIVLTLRADFFDQPLLYPEFAEKFRSNVVAVSPPTRDGLARAISQPALGAGVSLEPGLVSRIVDDVREQPGGLPLLQFSLTELFARRENEILTLDSYRATGGVGGALAKRAEETYSSLSSQGREAARQLFLRLVTVDELADDTRRRVRQSELLGLDVDRTVMSDTMQQFGALRFLSFDRDAASRAPTVELAHEALLREWSRLKTWIDERREDLLIHRRIQITVQDWLERGKDSSYLLRGSRLEQALLWVDRTDIAVSNEEMSLIEASIEAEKREEAERLALEEKAARRRKAVVWVLAGGLVVAGVLGAVALDRSQNARITAAEATARELSAAAIAAIEEDPELGILLSLEAMASTDSVGVESVPEAASALRTTLAEMRIEARLPTGFQAIAYGQDGTTIITDDTEAPSALHLIDAETTNPIATWDAEDVSGFPPAEVLTTGTSPIDGQVVVSWSAPDHPMGTNRLDPGLALSDDDQMVALSFHDPSTLELGRTLWGEPGLYWEPTFGAGGLVSAALAGLTPVGRAYVWGVETGEVVYIHESDDPEAQIWDAEFIPGTTVLLLMYGPDDHAVPGRIVAVEGTTSEELWSLTIPGDPVILDVSPDGSTLAIGYETNSIQIWDVDSQEFQLDIEHQNPQTLTWSADGARLAVSGFDGNVTIFDRDLDWESSLILTGHKASVFGTAFHPNRETLISVSIDGDARAWNVTKAGEQDDVAFDTGSPVGQFFLGPGDNRVIAGTQEAGVNTVDLASGEVEAILPIPSPFHFSPSESLATVVGNMDDGRGAVVDAASGRVTRVFPQCLSPRAISPQERLVVLDAVQACGSDGTDTPSQVLDLDSGEVLIDLGRRMVFKAVFSPSNTFDGERYVVVNINSVIIEIYSLEDGQSVASYSLDDLRAEGFLVLSLDPQGRYLGIGGAHSRPLVIDMVAIMSGAPKMDAVVFDLEAHKAGIPQVRVTSDGLVASAPFDGVYRVWDIATEELQFEIRVDGLVDQGAAQFTWDGTQLAYEDADGVIRFTPIDNHEVIARARAALTRTLTDDECRQYLHTASCPGS
jgi:DNA-binding SARP family transcriptional activator/WD40 repeat protein